MVPESPTMIGLLWPIISRAVRVYRELNYTLLYINVGAEDFSGSCFRLRPYNYYTLHVCSMAKIVDLESIISLVVIISMIAAKKMHH